MIVAGPALEIAPLDWLILRIGKDQRTVLRERCRSQRKKKERQLPRPREEPQGEGPDLAPHPPHCKHHCPVSVAMTFQLGSREDTSRAKVQTSVTSVTFS